MKRFLCVLIIAVFLCAIGAPTFAAAEKKAANDEYDPQYTVQVLNYARLSLYTLGKNPNKLVAAQEFNNILNQLDVTKVKDDASLQDLYAKMLKYFKKVELEETDKDYIKRVYEAKAREIFLNIPSKSELRAGALAAAGKSAAMGNDSAGGVNAGGGVLSLLVRVGGSLLQGGAGLWEAGDKHDRLKQQAKGAEERYMQERFANEWQIDKALLDDFASVRIALFNTDWSMAGKYKINKKNVLLNDPMLETLYNRLISVTDMRTALKNARSLRRDFGGQPQFWFYYGRAALACGDKELARECFAKFMDINRPVLREDILAASAAASMILTLKDTEIDEAKRLLEIIVDNARHDGNLLLFAGLEYFALGEKELAKEQFEYNINILEHNVEVNKELLSQADTGKIDFNAVQGVAVRQFKEPSDLERWAKAGNAEAQYILGESLYRNTSISDSNPGVQWLIKAAKQDHFFAKCQLALLFPDKAEWNKDGKLLVAELERQKSSSSIATTLLALFYEKGLHTTKDAKKAFSLYQEAAEQGYARAQFTLAFYCFEGIGIAKDMKQAFAWYRKAAEQGYAPAQFSLGACYDEGIGTAKDVKLAFTWYEKAAGQGFALAQFDLGRCYLTGSGVARDSNQAFFWFSKAAEQGEANAQSALGFLYEKGAGVAKDMKQAFIWYSKAAEQGIAPVQYRLGVCYINGDGVAKDQAQAIVWFKKAAEQGNEDAQKALARLHETPKTSNRLSYTKSEDKQFNEYLLAARADDIQAQYNVGKCYEEGIGTEKDRDMALFWYYKAAAKKHREAEAALIRLGVR